jgi:hypothetical protein
MSYVPPAGVLGHAVAALFGADPKQDMDDDLLRLKTFIETGITPHDAAERSVNQRRRKTTHRLQSPAAEEQGRERRAEPVNVSQGPGDMPESRPGPGRHIVPGGMGPLD